MYTPAEDSVLLANTVGSYHGDVALEIGTGSGIVAGALKRNYNRVIASDIDFSTLQSCKKAHPDMDLICCDAAQPFARKFDLIVSNPPYLPGSPDQDLTIYGGSRGVETTLRFARTAARALNAGGAMLFIVSSLSDLGYLNQALFRMGLSARTVAEKRLFYETISVIEVK